MSFNFSLTGFENIGVSAAVMLIVHIVTIAIAILNYIFYSMALFSVGKRRGLPLYGLAWVPFGQEWLLGSIADQYERKKNGRDRKLRTFLFVSEIVTFAVSLISCVMIVVGALSMEFGTAENAGIALLVVGCVLLLLVCIYLVVVAVFMYIALYKYFASCSPKNAVWMLILSILFGSLLMAIFMFCVRRKDDGFAKLQESAEPQPTE